MHLFVAAPRVLAIAVGVWVFYFFLRLNCGRTRSLVAARLVFASLFLIILLALTGVIGLVGMGKGNGHLLKAEFILRDGVRLGLILLTAASFHPSVITPLIAPVNYRPPVFVLWTIAVLMFAACIFDILFLFLDEFPITSFLLSVLSSFLILALFIRIALIRLRSSFRLFGWIVLAGFQLLALGIAAIHLKVPTGALDIVDWFFILLWTTGTSIAILSMFSIHLNARSTSPHLQPTRRFLHVNVSEDFQAYNDPFAAPISIRLSRHQPNHSPGNSPYNRPRPISVSSSRKGRSSFLPFSISPSRPTTPRRMPETKMNSEVTNTPSFHSAEMYQDYHSSEEPSTQEKLTMYSRVPSLPLSVYHSPSQSEDRHSQSQPRSINLSPYTSPLQPDIEIAITTPPPPHPITIPNGRLNISRDRTPTQSFHAPSFVSSISRYSQLTSNTEKAEDPMLRDSSDNNNGAKGEFPSNADTSTIGSNSETAEGQMLKDSSDNNNGAKGEFPSMADTSTIGSNNETAEDQVLKDSSDNNNGAKGEFPSIADTSTIGSNSETAEDRKLEDSFYHENIHALGKPKFLASLPAFPPLMDTPDDMFMFDYETSGDMSKDSSLSVEDSTEQSITLVEGGTADVGIPSADKNVEDKQMGGHELP